MQAKPRFVFVFVLLLCSHHPGLNLRHKETSKIPWVQETFHARLPLTLTQKNVLYFRMQTRRWLGSAVSRQH